MKSFHVMEPPRRFLRFGVLFLFACFVGSALALYADTLAGLRAATVGTCYCHCEESSAHRACVKMCDAPKYAARAWATTCAKPRMNLPIKKEDAGQRFPRPGREERVQIPKTSSAS
jgi:hypothetical protein